MFDNTDVNYIIYLLKRSKEHKTHDFQIWNGSAKYILNQLLRQIKLPKENWYVTHKADILWNQITTDKMEDYSYKKKLTLTRNEKLTVATFKGNSKTPTIWYLNKGNSFEFREVFHEEHTIPINIIIDELLKLESINYESVVGILKKISICKMLKIEDRSIYDARKRSFDFNEVIETTYLESNVYVKDYPYKHIKQYTEEDDLYLESIDLMIPKEAIVEFFPHPESYGYKMALLSNGCFTDVYENGSGDYYSRTNDLKLINYMMILHKVFDKSVSSILE